MKNVIITVGLVILMSASLISNAELENLRLDILEERETAKELAHLGALSIEFDGEEKSVNPKALIEEIRNTQGVKSLKAEVLTGDESLVFDSSGAYTVLPVESGFVGCYVTIEFSEKSYAGFRIPRLQSACYEYIGGDKGKLSLSAMSCAD